MIYTTHENGKFGDGGSYCFTHISVFSLGGGVILYSTLKSEYLICLWQWDVNLEHSCRATSQLAQLLKPRKGIPRVHLHLTLLHECSLRLDQGGPGHPLEATGYPEVDIEKNADFKAMVSRSENNLPLLAFQHSYGTWPTSRWFTYWKWWCAIDSCPGIFSEETIPCYFCHTIRPEQGGSSRNLKQMSSDSKLDLIGGISPKKKSKASMSQDIVWTSNMSKHKTHIDTHRHT